MGLFAGVESFCEGNEMKKEFDLEEVYDNEIAPLMETIIGICKEHKLPMFATFLYAANDEQDDFCSTNLLFKERAIPEALSSLEPIIRRGSSVPPLRMRVTKGDGSVEDTVILG
jgi:hypothetical protein